jgi:succinate dehydrogenase / fumarate reductase cytochrome b subunit
MSSAVAGLAHSRAVGFFASTIGKKAVMAITGAVLFAFVIGHLVGNLQFFEEPEKLNNYGKFLRSMPAVLWGTRLILLAMVILHIVTATQLALRKRAARPIKYVKRKAIESSYASRTMYWSGPIIAAFVVYHLLDFTFGKLNPGFEEGNVYGNIVRSFQQPAVSIFYMIAMLFLGLHLYHGFWSMFQSLGLTHPRWTSALKRASATLAILITAGFISIPIAVLTGLRS